MMLGIVAIALPFLIPISVPPVSTFASQSLATLGCLGWMAFDHRRVQEQHNATGMGWGQAAAILSVALLMLTLAQLAGRSAFGSRVMAMASLLVAVGLVTIGARREEGTAQTLLAALLVASIASSLIAVVQVFLPSWADGRLVAYPTAPGRAVGNMRQPNQLATLLVWGGGALIGWGAWKRWPAGRIGAVLWILTLAVVLSASRTGMVGIGMLALWGLIDRRLSPRLRLLMLATLPLYFAGWWAMEQWSAHTGDFFYGDDQIKKTLHGDPSSSRGRIWANTLSLIAAHPWTGVGAGRFNFVWSMTPFPNRPIAFFDHSHNLPLQLAVESGIPFALLVLGLLGWAFWRARVALFVADDREAIVARSLAFMLAVIGVHSLLEYPLWYTYFLFPTALMAGCLCGAAERARPGGGRVWFSVHPRLVSVACLIGLAVMVWVGRQYYQVAVIFDPSWSIGEAAPLSERIRVGQQSVLFGHHADYAKVTMSEHPEEEVEAFARTSYHLLDTRLMIAYAKALAARGQEVEARHVAARLREFRNPASDTFFEPCHHPAAPGTPLPFQCGPDPRLSADAVRPEVVFAPDALKNRR